MTAEPTLADIGEFAVIGRIAKIVGAVRISPGEVGVGDDAAVIRLGRDPRVVATTDVLIEGRHFRRDWSSAYDIGRKAAAQNLADIEAMGARPVSLLVAFAAPGTTTVQFAEDVARGLVDEAAAAGAVVSGGDLSAAATISLSITALGSLDGRRPVLRSGAREGEFVYAVGALGWSAAGLALLHRADSALLERYATLVAAHRVPGPPYGYGRVAAEAGATSMIDVSDGLLADLQHLLDASAVGADLVALPWYDDGLGAAAQDLGVDSAPWILDGGEDHCLLYTLPPGISAPDHPALCRIGVVTARSGIRIDGLAVEPVGFDHFATP